MASLRTTANQFVEPFNKQATSGESDLPGNVVGVGTGFHLCRPQAEPIFDAVLHNIFRSLFYAQTGFFAVSYERTISVLQGT